LSPVTRAQFLAGAAGTLFVTADTDLAKVAATGELLAIDFYRQAIASRHFNGDELAYLRTAHANEVTHYGLLHDALGKATPKGVRFKYPQESSRRARASRRSRRRSRPRSSAPTSAPSAPSRASC
jgi:hypothetical protein